MSIKAGLVVVTEFCTPDSGEFKAYIDYIDRKEAIRAKHIKDYNLFSGYLDYVGNPMKASGLFTQDYDELDTVQKKSLKETFQKAQENNSLMWQTVISFDNQWLSEHGLFDKKTKMLNEKALMVAARKSIDEMLKKEGLEGATWAADFHHNTDNIHIHVATVEAIPTRKKKSFIQYEKEKSEGKWKYKLQYNSETGRKEKIAILDEKGIPVIKEEYVGKFKQESLRVCKTTLVKEIAMAKEENINITNIIRNRILGKDYMEQLYADKDFRDSFLELYNLMPQKVSRNMWTYNSSVIKPYRDKIDSLSKKYIEKYHKEQFDALKEKLGAQEANYREAYGGQTNDYTENKLKDMYARLGNSILREIKNLDKEMRIKERSILDLKGDRKKYREVLSDFYSSPPENRGRKLGEIIDTLTKLSEKEDSMAMYELGKLYKNESSICSERKAIFWFEKAATHDNEYAQYQLGNIYANPQSNNFNVKRAVYMLEKASEKGNVFAQLRLGLLYYKGEVVERDSKKATAFFIKAEKNGSSFATDILERMKQEDKRIAMQRSPLRLVDERSLRLALRYLQKSLRYNLEHYLNKQKYHEMQAELEQSEEEYQ